MDSAEFARCGDLERRLAEAYYKLLTSLDWTDVLLIAGLREGLNKFLSNAFISLCPGGHKYHRTHLVSPAALDQLRNGNVRALVYEHLVPKTRYIQRPCEQAAARGLLKLDEVTKLLNLYWRTATITRDEESRLTRLVMPEDWDGQEVLARYRAAGISLLPNPFFSAATA